MTDDARPVSPKKLVDQSIHDFAQQLAEGLEAEGAGAISEAAVVELSLAFQQAYEDWAEDVWQTGE